MTNSIQKLMMPAFSLDVKNLPSIRNLFLHAIYLSVRFLRPKSFSIILANYKYFLVLLCGIKTIAHFSATYVHPAHCSAQFILTIFRFLLKNPCTSLPQTKILKFYILLEMASKKRKNQQQVNVLWLQYMDKCLRYCSVGKMYHQ